MSGADRATLRGLCLAFVCCAATTVAADPSQGATPQPTRAPADLTALSPDELSEIRVTSVAKREQRLAETARAVFVITREDIRRSGATSIPEALRLAPGIDVARIDSDKWAITSRGFNSRFANKLLVLVDGRSVYTPLFSGVFWDVQDTLLEDVDRIEVIRGPGAAIWGANAVNGVVSVITRKAKESAGAFASVGGGSGERIFGAARWGGALSKRSDLRVYAKGFQRDRSPDAPSPSDRWDVEQAGARAEWSLGPATSLTVQGDVYSGHEEDRETVATLTPPFAATLAGEGSVDGGNALASFKAAAPWGGDLTIQAFYDRTRRSDVIHWESRNTWDVDVLQHLALAKVHDVTLGLGYRSTSDDIASGFTIAFRPETKRDELWSGFVQDDVWLAPALRLTLGAKFEHNDYTGFEFQPDIRLLLTPTRKATLWVAVSRAVRTPSRFERDARVDLQVASVTNGVPVLASIFGSGSFRSETLIAYEIGARWQAGKRFSIDATAFYDSYDRLRTFEPGSPYPEPGDPFHIVAPLRPANEMEGEGRGVEVATTWSVTDTLRVRASYSGLWIDLRLKPGSQDGLSFAAEGDSPKHQARLFVSWDPAPRWEADGLLYVVDRVPNQNVPGYARLDARLGFALTRQLSLDVVGQDLLRARHREVGAAYLVSPADIGCRVFGRVAWRF